MAMTKTSKSIIDSSDLKIINNWSLETRKWYFHRSDRHNYLNLNRQQNDREGMLACLKDHHYHHHHWEVSQHHHRHHRHHHHHDEYDGDQG